MPQLPNEAALEMTAGHRNTTAPVAEQRKSDSYIFKSSIIKQHEIIIMDLSVAYKCQINFFFFDGVILILLLWSVLN